MKSRLHLPYVSAWILLLAGCFFAAYLHVGLLPTQELRIQVQDRLRDWTGRKVAFTKALFIPGLGLVVEDFFLNEPDDTPLFSAKKIAINLRILPFLIEKKIVIRNIILDTPVVEWAHKTPGPPAPAVQTQISGQINVPIAPTGHTISPASLQAEGADALLPENVYIEQIEIRHGQAQFRSMTGDLRERVEIEHLKMSYRKPPVVDIDGEILVGSPVYATLKINGGWDLARSGYDFFLRLQSSQVPKWLDAYQQKHILILRDGKTELVAKLSSITETRASFHAKAKLSRAHIQAAQASILGETSFDAKGVFDFNRQAFERYKGTLFLNNVDLQNLSKQFPRIDHVTGRVGFEPDKVTIESIRGQWKKLTFEAMGSIRSFKELLLDGEIRSRMTIDDVLELIPSDQKKLLSGFHLSGHCDAVTRLRGSLRPGEKLTQEYRLAIHHGILENRQRKLRLDDLSAEFFSDPQSFKIKNAHFRSGTTPYQLEASIPQKPATQGSLALSAPAWKLRADYDLQTNGIRIREGQAQGYGATLTFFGKATNFNNPWLNLQGKIRADLSSLNSLPAGASQALSGAGLRGVLSGPFTLAGPWSKPTDWDLRIDASSPLVTVKDWCRLDDFEIQLRSQNGLIQIPYIHARPYGGSIAASYTIHLDQSPAFFDMNVTGNGLELSRITRDLAPAGRQDNSGKILFKLQMRGPLTHSARWLGGGSAAILDGQFGRTDRFKDMGKLPFVRVEGMDDVTFHQMKANFTVKNKHIYTQDLALYGDNVNLLLYGSVGFNANLDLGMKIRYSDDVLDGALDTGGIVPFVLSEANSMISDYRVRGTLSKPVFEKSALPVNPIGSVGKKVNTLAKALTN